MTHLRILYFLLQLDVKVQDKFLFCQSLPNKIIKEAILKLVNDFTVYNRVKLIQVPIPVLITLQQ
jgi:hypothetical protein